MKIHGLMVGVLGLAALGLRAEQTAPVVTAPVPVTAPAEAPAVVKPPATIVSPGTLRPASGPQQPLLTPEEGRILGQARSQLQKDPELMEMNAQIKALMEKREKLTEEKLEKLNPEAAAIFKRLKEQQEKMMAERRAQAEAYKAKLKAQQEAKPATPPADAPAATPAPAPAAPVAAPAVPAATP